MAVTIPGIERNDKGPLGGEAGRPVMEETVVCDRLSTPPRKWGAEIGTS